MVDRAESDRLRDRKIAAEISFKLRFADFSALLYSLLLLLSRFSRVRLCVTLWTAAYQAPPSPWDFPGKSTGVGCNCTL